MKIIILIFLLSVSSIHAQSGQKYIKQFHYDGLGTPMRNDSLVSYSKDCKQSVLHAGMVLETNTNKVREAFLRGTEGQRVYINVKDPRELKKVFEQFKDGHLEKSKCQDVIVVDNKQENVPNEFDRHTDEEIQEALEKARVPYPGEVIKEKLE